MPKIGPSHDWGCSVPADVSTEEVIETRDKLRSGTVAIECLITVTVDDPEKIDQWELHREELHDQMLAAYEREAQRRLS